MNIELAKSQMLPNGALYFHEETGTAQLGDNEYQMVLVNCHTPGIKSRTTGKTFVFSWEDLLRISIESGIDDSESKGE